MNIEQFKRDVLLATENLGGVVPPPTFKHKFWYRFN